MIAKKNSKNINAEQSTTFVIKECQTLPLTNSKTVQKVTLFSDLKLQDSRIQKYITHKILS
jgi:hypothetical protein